MQMSIKYLAVAALLLARAPAWCQAPDAAAPADGRLAYMSAGCYQCHGLVGQGGVGPRLAPDPMPVEALSAFVRHASRNMPPYSEAVLPESELRRIHAYLASIKPSPAADQIPLLRQLGTLR